jgi:hypothetical protein
MDAAVVARLGSFPARLGVAARAVAAREAASGPPAGEWTARDVVAHLVSVERVVWQARLDTLGPGRDEPQWSWLEPGPVSEPAAASLEGALALFGAERAATLARITVLDEAGWARAGIHATYGRLDVAGLLRVATDHDDDHLAALEARAGD